MHRQTRTHRRACCTGRNETRREAHTWTPSWIRNSGSQIAHSPPPRLCPHRWEWGDTVRRAHLEALSGFKVCDWIQWTFLTFSSIHHACDFKTTRPIDVPDEWPECVKHGNLCGTVDVEPFLVEHAGRKEKKKSQTCGLRRRLNEPRLSVGANNSSRASPSLH